MAKHAAAQSVGDVVLVVVVGATVVVVVVVVAGAAVVNVVEVEVVGATVLVVVLVVAVLVVDGVEVVDVVVVAVLHWGRHSPATGVCSIRVSIVCVRDRTAPFTDAAWASGALQFCSATSRITRAATLGRRLTTVAVTAGEILRGTVWSSDAAPAAATVVVAAPVVVAGAGQESHAPGHTSATSLRPLPRK